jgi:hypothetical protein
MGADSLALVMVAVGVVGGLLLLSRSPSAPAQAARKARPAKSR